MLLHLIRHGQSTWNVEGRVQGQAMDVPLTALGVEQAGGRAMRSRTSRSPPCSAAIRPGRSRLPGWWRPHTDWASRPTAGSARSTSAAWRAGSPPTWYPRRPRRGARLRGPVGWGESLADVADRLRPCWPI
ncbi:phosphoglycerate mutase family protein [Tessaracoccus sp. HDW20]|nr:phosphoglycerate mutase family protein [Tessaracoccus coleopterorum]